MRAFGFHDLPFLFRGITQTTRDNMESYTDGVALAGLDGGFGQWAGVLPYSDDMNYAGMRARDNIEDYSNGALLDGLDGGMFWGNGYIDAENYTGFKAGDNMESYTDGADLDGLNGGSVSGATPAWTAYADDTNYLFTEFHIAADEITGLNDTDPVTTWEDTGDFNRDFAQATAANKPTYRTNQQNSLPGVAFATNDFMAATGMPDGIHASWMFVVSFNAAGATEIFYYQGSATNGIGCGSGTNALIQGRSGGGTQNGTNGAINAGTAEIWYFERSDSLTINLWINDIHRTPLAGVANPAVGTHTGNAWIGAFMGTSTFFNGMLFEAYMWDRPLSTAEREAFQDALAAKWGISI